MGVRDSSGRWHPVALFIPPGLIAILLLTVQLPGGGRFTQALQNAGHAGLFALLTLIVVPAIGNARTFARPWKCPTLALYIFSCLALGAVVELAQSYIGRQASWSDILLNMSGVGIGLCLLIGVRSGPSRQLRIGAVLTGVVLLAVSFTQPALWWYRQVQRDRQFPVIAEFGSRWVNPFSHASHGGHLAIVAAPAAWPGNDSPVAQLTLRRQGTWPGLTIADVYPDWRGHHALYFEIFSDNPQPLNLSLRIHDKLHNHRHGDRFNRRLDVAPGLNRYSILLEEVQRAPRSRNMDMGSIQALIWFVHRPPHEQVIFLDNVKLVPEPDSGPTHPTAY